MSIKPLRDQGAVEYTRDQLREFTKCAKDPAYFIRTYVKIQHPKHGVIPFTLYPYQERMLKAFTENRFCITLSARQTGKSQTSAAYLLWFGMFHFDKTILIASNKNSNALEMISRIRYMYESVPDWLKPGITADGWNKLSVVFDHGEEGDSRILSCATSESSGRGLSISLLFCDELAFVKPGIQEEFWRSISPTLSTGGSCIISSTPNGDTDLFSRLWREGEMGLPEAYFPIRVKWDEPPDRGEKFKQDQIAKLGALAWRQEFECCAGETMVTVRTSDDVVHTLTIDEMMSRYFDEV